jgi:RNA polymerase sigma-70 factor (ECF subfamily)
VGDLDGFEAFYTAAYRRVVGQVFALLGDLQEAEDVTQDAFAKASVHWRRIDLHRALGRLAPRHREVLVLRYVAELSVDEVARHLRLPAGTVKSRLNRARRALAEEFGDEREGVTNA